MTTDAIRLYGCTATPLASYLKALGLLRLVSSASNHAQGVAADAHARGWWEDGQFHLATCLGPEGLIRFLLDEYAPSAIIAPWNGGSGFYPKDNKEGIGPLTGTVATRFRTVASAIDVAGDEIRRRRWHTRPEAGAKADLIATLRGRLAESALQWLDATVALSGGRLSFPQLLGTGGNDGRLDFTNNFMRRLVAARDGLFDAATGAPAPQSERMLRASLDAGSAQGLRSYSAGQFSPGATGGANATVGYDGPARANPWDLVLALEGAVLFAGAATRRHQGAPETGASFPFTVRPTAAGWGGVAEADRTSVRAEFWAPLWARPAGCDELAGLLKEGRAILHGKTARDGLDFARAAASLGTSRGISAFQRYGFAMRQGNMYLAAPLGMRRVTAHVPEIAELVNDFDAGGWLQQVRRLAQDRNAPVRAQQAMKRFQDALFALTDSRVPSATVQNALETLGDLVGWLVTSLDARASTRPPPLLRRAWVRHADDGTAEYRAAAGLASLGWAASSLNKPSRAKTTDRRPGAMDETRTPLGAEATAGAPQPSMPMAAHLAPVAPATVTRQFREWDRGGNGALATWGAGGLTANLIEVLEQRTRLSSVNQPFTAAAPTQAEVVSRFLSGSFDVRRCARLLAGLVWSQPTALQRIPSDADQPGPPFAYAALKLLFAPVHVVDGLAERRGEERVRRLPVPPGLVANLRRGEVDGAVRLALARARASGLASPFAHGRGAPTTGFGVGTDGGRLTAAMLIPIHDHQLHTLLERAYPTEKENEYVA
ncbi:MAG: type I-U CRISPR-associated protein Csx17 [Gammaproteobacteria bacterium]|nr:type I-U CRISPR-associated protein Csx17 [Gammaproteobacteria bacterium]